MENGFLRQLRWVMGTGNLMKNNKWLGKRSAKNLEPNLRRSTCETSNPGFSHFRKLGLKMRKNLRSKYQFIKMIKTSFAITGEKG